MAVDPDFSPGCCKKVTLPSLHRSQVPLGYSRRRVRAQSEPQASDAMEAIILQTQLKGLGAAKRLARRGRFIFAIRHLVLSNPGIPCHEAKSAVASFAFGDPPERPDKVRLPISVID